MTGEKELADLIIFTLMGSGIVALIVGLAFSE